MRMFLAIELSDEVRAHLVGVQEALARELHGVAMTKGENLHVTLKFLGEVDERRVVELCESFAKVTSSEVELAAEKVECFPERGPVRIVAAAMAGEIETLAGLHAGIEQRCKFLGFEKENRKYRPHVTLARARGAVSDGART